MRAAYLESVGNLVLRDIPVPAITRPDEVQIQVKVVGVCGSEVHAFEGTHPFRKAPVILGHEMAGVVTATGPQVTRFKPGDRVVVDPQWSCGECVYCRAGDINLCLTKKVLGTQAWPGAFGEVITSPEEAVYALPENLSFAQGSLIEPLTIGVHVARRAALRPGQSMVVLGAGSIGGMVSAVARAEGANPIVAVDIRQHCLDAARERMGATHDFLLPDPEIEKKIKSVVGELGADVVVVAADEPALVDLALDLIKKRGTVVLVALLTGDPLVFSGFKVIIKEAHIIGCTMSSKEDVERAIYLAASGQVDVSGIHTHTLPFEQIQRGMVMAADKTDRAIKVVLEY